MSASRAANAAKVGPRVGKSVPKPKGIFGKIVEKFGKAGKWIKQLGSRFIMPLVTNPYGWAILGGLALGGLAYAYWDEVKAAWNKVTNFVSETFSKISEFASSLAGNARTMLGDFLRSVGAGMIADWIDPDGADPEKKKEEFTWKNLGLELWNIYTGIWKKVLDLAKSAGKAVGKIAAGFARKMGFDGVADWIEEKIGDEPKKEDYHFDLSEEEQNAIPGMEERAAAGSWSDFEKTDKGKEYLKTFKDSKTGKVGVTSSGSRKRARAAWEAGGVSGHGSVASDDFTGGGTPPAAASGTPPAGGGTPELAKVVTDAGYTLTTASFKPSESEDDSSLKPATTEQMPPSWEKRSKPKIESLLHTSFQGQMKNLISGMWTKHGIDIGIASTTRGAAEQNALKEKGASKAEFGKSLHNYGAAADVFFNTHGKGGIYDGPWDKLSSMGKGLGMRWGGDWKSFQDKPHFQADMNWHDAKEKGLALAAAKGFSGIVKKPTVFLTGEAGPELVHITPLISPDAKTTGLNNIHSENAQLKDQQGSAATMVNAPSVDVTNNSGSNIILASNTAQGGMDLSNVM